MNAFAVLGLLVGVFAWTTVLSVMEGLQGDIKGRILKEKPHLLWEGKPSHDLTTALQSIPPALRAHISDLGGILQSEGMLELPSSGTQKRVRGSGVVLQGVEGHPSGQATLGIELASQLGLREGDEVRLLSVWKLEANPLTVHVAGTFDTGLYDVDRTVVKLSKSDLESWLGIPGSISRLELKLKDPMEAAALAPGLSTALGVTLLPWQDTQAALWYSLRLEKLVMGIALFFVVLLGAMAVHLALSVRVAEKTREIGVLRALGADPRQLSKIYLIEGIALGTVGSFAGLLLARGLCFLIANQLRLPAFYYSTKIPVAWSWSQTLSMALLGVLLATLASWIPSKRVLNVEIQHALRA